VKDAVIIGSGLAGLSAAWRLRDLDIAVLEASDRVGGRIRSERRGPYWLNWGAHVFGGPQSATGYVLDAVGVEAAPVPGALSALAMNGKLLLGGRIESYPFRVPMSWKSRAALMRAGLKVRLAVRRYAQIATPRPGEHHRERQQRIYDHLDHQTFSDYIGDLPPDADAMFRPTVSRSAGDPEQISAGAGIAYFHLVWNKGEGLSRNVIGGSSTFTDAIAATLGHALHLRAAAAEVVRGRRSVVVRYTQDGKAHELEARHAILATPAPVTRQIAVDIDDEVGAALDRIVYGPYVSAAILTNESARQAWDDVYAIAAPKRSFTVALNMSNVVRARERDRRPGSSLMVFSPASLGGRLLGLSDEEIIATYTRDLDEILPGISSHIVESHVQRWSLGAAYRFPGRGRLQPLLTRPMDRLFLAGDYLGTLYTETAIQTGLQAADQVRDALKAAPPLPDRENEVHRESRSA
jgi:oxygen-dependent protoporphyrinogen oxidase